MKAQTHTYSRARRAALLAVCILLVLLGTLLVPNGFSESNGEGIAEPYKTEKTARAATASRGTLFGAALRQTSAGAKAPGQSPRNSILLEAMQALGDSAGEAAVEVAEEPQGAAGDQGTTDSEQSSSFGIATKPGLNTMTYTLHEGGKTYTVTLQYKDDAGIPQNADLVADLLDNTDPDAAAQREEKLLSRLDLKEDEHVLQTTFLEIKLVADGATIQPQSPVTLSIQTDAIAPKESDAVEVVALNSDEATVSSFENLTGKAPEDAVSEGVGSKNADAKGSESEDSVAVEVEAEAEGTDAAQSTDATTPKESCVSFIASELGEFGLATVVQPKFTWAIDETTVQLWGPRNIQVEVEDTSGDGGTIDDMELLDSFVMKMESNHTWVPSLWLTSVMDEYAWQYATSDVTCYSVKDGELDDEVFSMPGKNRYMAIDADGTYALLQRERSYDLRVDVGDVHVESTVPEITAVAVQDVTGEYDDAAAVVGDAGDNTYGYETVAAYDVILDSQGNAWQPDEEHKVTATVDNDVIDSDVELQILHMDGEGVTEQVDVSSIEPGSVSFDMLSDGTYVIVERVSLVREFTVSNNKTYRITVSYDGSAGLPSDAALEVFEITGGKEYDGYVTSAAKELNVKDKDISYAKAFDINLLNPATGEKYQPTGDVTVSIELLDEEVDNTANTSVVHFPNSSNEKNPYDGAQAVDSTVEDGVVWFESSSFSVFLLMSDTGAPRLTITAGSATKTYDGEALTSDEFELTAGTLQEGHSIQSVTVEGTQTDAGASENVAKDAVIVDASGTNVTSAYDISYVPGTLTVEPQGVTLTANSGTREYNNGEAVDAFGYTCNVDGLTFEGVSVKTEDGATQPGMYDIVFDGVTIGETKDTTGNYVVSATQNGLLIIEDDDESPIVSKRMTKFEGNRAYYEIVVNPKGHILNDGHPYTLKDAFGTDENHPQSVNYGSISAVCEQNNGDSVTWDYSGYTGTFSIPDGTRVTITYFTRVNGDAGDEVNVTNTAELGKMVGKTFVCAASDTVNETVTIEPDINGTGGVYSIDLFVYADGHMETGLGGATFRLLDENQRPLKYLAGDKTGKEITFTTSKGDEGEPRLGHVTIGLDEDTDGLSIHKNTVYYLEMVTAPYTLEGGVYTYYQRDNTYYSFLITDDPSYTYGSVYSYFNGDVMKVRCYPESDGINVMKRFTGNYELTPEQKNGITFTLQKEDWNSESGWVDIEDHDYSEFKYGTITFDTKKSDLEEAATYRVVETNALPDELSDTIDLNSTVSVTYQVKGEPVEDETGEFFVDPDDESQRNYSFVFTNEYVDHRLTLIKVDELTGTMLPGAEFSVYAALDDQDPIETYITDEDGKLSVKKSDSESYEYDTLYYIKETHEPTDYLLPHNPERTYFYFSQDSESVPDGLPEGKTATDLSTSYNTKAILNQSKWVDVPVTVSWGPDGDTGEDAWPDEVKSIEIHLYKSVDGAPATPVTDEDDKPLTATLYKDTYYDAKSFTHLPAEESGKTVTYSVVEEQIKDNNDEDIKGSYAQTSSISAPGWYIINNQDAVSVTIKKEWYEQDGTTRITDTSGMESVTFDLYRTTNEHAGDLTRDQLVEALGSANPVRTGLTLSNGTSELDRWTLSVRSLEKTDKDGNTWYYYALEHIPNNQIDSYVVTPASDSAPRTLTIKNQQTPPTVTITAKDLEKTYGQDDPAFVIEADVKEEGSTVTIAGPDSEGAYTATVTKRPSMSAEQFKFKVSREQGEDVRPSDPYAITFTSISAPDGYRVLYVPGTLTIKPVEVTVTAGAEKVYGDADPALVTITGLPEGTSPSVIAYTASREEGQDVGTYPITVAGEEDQGNYHVTFDVDNKNLTITPAPVTVTADNKTKVYGEDDPEFTATVTGLKYDDSATVIEYELTRGAGEDVGEYTITPAGDAEQGNYTVSYGTGKLTINRAALTISVDDADKIYGEGDPEWNVTIDGLQGEDDGGRLDVSGDDSARIYKYYKPGSETELLTFRVTREVGEDVNEGGYEIVPDGAEEQGNYTVSYTYGKLSISKAELTVIANNMVKAKLDPPVADPILTATIEGWANNDGTESTAESSVDSNGVVTWTYSRDGKTILTFTLTRASGEDEGEYAITAAGDTQQPNYFVAFEDGTFSILSMFNVEVSQATEDLVEPTANPEYSYTATVDLSGTGLSGKYNDNDFSDGVLSFTLPGVEAANQKTLRVPAGAKLTVTQNTSNSSYATSIEVDGGPYGGTEACTINSVDDFYAIKFVHTRITMPVQAMTTEGETEEGATVVAGSRGYIGIPESALAIDGSFAAAYQARIGYTLPTDKYYAYDHASLYDSDGNLVEGASNVTGVKYDDQSAKWQYKVGTGSAFIDVPDGAQLMLFYEPKFICQVEMQNGMQRFYTLNAAMEAIAAENKPYEDAAADAAEATAREENAGKTEAEIKKAVDAARQAAIDATTIEKTIEMLTDYTMPYSDMVNIPVNNIITLTTASDYEGEGRTATISRGTDFTSGGLFTNRGSLTLSNITLDGNNVAASSCMVASIDKATAHLTVSANATLTNANGQNGSAIYVSAGTATIEGNVTGNSADTGAAVSVAGGTVDINSNITANHATHGGALYITGGTVNVNAGSTIGGTDDADANTATNGGAAYLTGGTLNVYGAIVGNTATSGGAVFMTGGTVNSSGSVTGNTATANGGAFYIEGGTINTSGTASNNTAAGSGGLVYGTNGNITISDGTVSGNIATNGNGGAICYGGGGGVTVSAGTITKNAANSGFGGAIYQSAGASTLSGGIIGKTDAEDAANTAKNGSAVYVEDGSATFSGVTIKNNSATEGGAVGIGSATARLHFSGDTVISSNKTDGAVRNVYFDQDSDLIINTSGLGNNADIGIYVVDDLFNSRGDACTLFGTYTAYTNVAKFKNDRSSVLKAWYYNYKLIWTVPIKYYVYYVKSFNSNFPPTTTSRTTIKSNITYYPHSKTNSVYDLVMEWTPSYSTSVANYVYAYSFANGASTNGTGWNEFLTSVDWDTASQKWIFKHEGTNVTKNNTSNTLHVYYSDAAYVSITNNSDYSLTIDPLTVLGQNVVTKNYGYPTVIDYLTQTTLTPIANSVDDPSTTEVEAHVVEDGKIVIPSKGYVKLLFPGACTSAWSMEGVFTDASAGDAIDYTLDSLNTDTPKQPLDTTPVEGGGLSFSFSGYKTLANGKTYDILFGDPTPICKIEDNNATGGVQNASGKYEHAFPTLNEAYDYIVDHSAALNNTATIQMLMDYLQPGDDVLEIAGGYDITLTTAAKRGTEGVVYTYFGADETRATISRDSDNDGAAVIAETNAGTICTTLAECNGSSLTVTNLIFDGKALAKKGNGGAISTLNNIVEVRNCEFKGYEAQRGGALFVAWGKCTVEDTNFTNCITGDKEDKTGGGGIWATSKELIVRRCNFDHCACESGKSQGGAAFHNINADDAFVYSGAPEKFAKFANNFYVGTTTEFTDCHFTDCYAEGGSGGTVESDAMIITFSSCSFNGSYSNKSGANGGAINILHKSAYNGNNTYSPLTGSSLTLNDCTFENCQTQQAKSNGGAICAANTKDIMISGCLFKDTSSDNGGAIKVHTNGCSLTIEDTSFENCNARVQGGAVFTQAQTLSIDGTYTGKTFTFRNCTSPKYGAVYQNRNSANSSVSVSDATFENCVSYNSEAGALYANALILSVKSTSFAYCSGTGSGGALYHIGSVETLTNCTFDHCSSGNNGGGAYLDATVTANGGSTLTGANTVSVSASEGHKNSATNCSAVNNGGGFYIKAVNGATLTGCDFLSNTLSATNGSGGSLYLSVTGKNCSSTLTDCNVSESVAANGGGIYHNAGTLYFNSGSISDCNSSISGGGLYSKASCYLGDVASSDRVAISECNAVSTGGGVHHTTNIYLRNTSISNCCAKQGGGIYSAGYFEVNQSEYAFSITGCRAKNVTLDDNGSVTIADEFDSDNLGGGIYRSANNTNIKSSTGLISGCSAYDGGGIYYATSGTLTLTAGSFVGNTADHYGGGIYQSVGTINYSGGTISGNEAKYGGGLYKAGGTLTMSGGTVGGSSENANTAETGAGVCVADGQTMTMSGGRITHNHATTAGGGIAVGGSSAKLNFQGTVVVQNNTMEVVQDEETKNVDCNVYLDQDSNSIINTTGTELGANSYIGVYCSDEQDPSHGYSGMPFGTYNKTANLNRFFNDRRPYLYGVKGTANNQIVWCTFVCKITDGAGNLLYKDAAGTPAAYSKLENGDGTDKGNAFGTLANSNPGLYRKTESGYEAYTATNYQVQMLVQEYAVPNQIKHNTNKAITLTTASTEPDECGLYYGGDQKHPYATVVRSASYGSMIYLTTSTPTITLREIVVDGGSQSGLKSTSAGGILFIEKGSVTIGANAILRNSDAGGNSGGAIRMQGTSLTLDGGTISNCQSTGYGGGISVKSGTFTMNSGSITGCNGQYGGAVRVDTTMYMNGGSITGNNATNTGGGISFGTNKSKVYFSGAPRVIENTLNGTTPCNVQLDELDSAESVMTGIINASGLQDGAEIGVYVPGDKSNDKSTFGKYGAEGKPFGTWQQQGQDIWHEDDKPYCFVNDRNPELNIELRGSQGTSTDSNIYWARNFLLTLNTEVVSDLAADHSAEYEYTIAINSENARMRNFSGVHFDNEGKTKQRLKDGESLTIYFPASVIETPGEPVPYTITVNSVTSSDAGTTLDDFDTSIKQNEGTSNAQVLSNARTVSGNLGENLTITPPSGRSTATFAYTRQTGTLTVSKTVVSQDDDDKNTSYPFTLTLGDASISGTYAAKDAAGNAIEDGVSFELGVATFDLIDSESITIEGLPTDLAYTVSEDKSGIADSVRIRTKVSKDGAAAVTASAETGTVGEHYTTVGETKVYASEVDFTNSYMEIICKITNRNRNLLYYRESNGKLVQAVFDNLADAFAMVNSGGLRTSSGGSVSGLLRIEMVVPEYTMNAPATLNSGKTVILSTALTSDADWPYNKGNDDDREGASKNVSVVTRGNFGDSMIADSGVLTLDKITLDGGSTAGLSATSNGGIVQVNGAVTLTVNNAAKLQNSKTSGNGGAISLGSGATLNMNGTIDNCSAASGGGIYAESGFEKMTMYGTVSNCTAETGNGGGLCAATGGSITVYDDAAFTGNKADAGNGGAICSNANLILRGAVGASGTGHANTAANGGGIYMGQGTTFTMYSTGSIERNTATNSGGGLYTLGVARIAGGRITNNYAAPLYSGLGGGVYAGNSASVTISGSPTFSGNMAAVGGAVYDGGSVSMSGGNVVANEANGKGGAVYVAAGKTFTMSGGSITSGNRSPEGAISTDEESALVFSGNAVVTGNSNIYTDSKDKIDMNVYLAFDSNDIIRTTGLGSYANIGVYVADGEDNSLLFEHGIADRNFGTYTGSTPDGARLGKFHNDRDTDLSGIAGDDKTGAGNDYFVMWPGKNLYIQVLQYDIQFDEEGEPLTDGQGNYIPVEDPAPIKGAEFTLTRVKYNADTNSQDEEQVWVGQSSSKADSEGLVTIPWSKIEATGNNTAIFARNSYYILEQRATDSKSVLPAGSWLIHIQEGNAVAWTKIEPGQSVNVVSNGTGTTATLTPETPPESEENRTFDIVPAPGEDGKPADGVLGDTFILYNDRQPNITFNANGGKLYSNSKDGQEEEKTDPVKFGDNTSVDYKISEKDPTWNTIFKNWNTVQEPTEDNPGVTYHKGDVYKFYRHTDNDDLTLYAQWVPVVCKITDRDGNLLYVDGLPAIYETLEAGFDSYSTDTFTNANGKRSTARYIKMLVDSYDLENPITLTGAKTGILATATSNEANEDGYPLHSNSGKTVCTIYRDFDGESMITTEKFNLHLANITLDGGASDGKTANVDGGIVSVKNSSYQLYVQNGATLCNSSTTGNGAAIYAAPGTKVYVNGGTIEDNSASNGAGIFLAENSAMYIAGAPGFSNNTVTLSGYDALTNGGESYANNEVEQDIFIAGYEDETPATSLVVNGNLTGEVGSIWVWAEKAPHYEEDEQFATLANTSYTGVDVFRNAQDDYTTSGSVRADFLRGATGREPTYVYWGTDGMDISFKKIDGTGAAMSGATFTLYSTYDSSTKTVSGAYENPAPATSADGTNTYTDSSSNTLDEGVVLFKAVPNGTYYMKETGTPSGSTYSNSETYVVLVGSSALSSYGSGVLENITLADIEAQTGTGTEAKAYAFFLIDSSTGKAVASASTSAVSTSTFTAPNIATFGIMNKSTKEHRVILKKVAKDNDAITALEGAQFRVFRADMTEVVGADYDSDAHCYRSLSSGVYLIDTLPEGKYYVVETGAPTDADYSGNAGKVFELTIGADGTTTQRTINGTQPTGAGTTATEQFLYAIGHS